MFTIRKQNIDCREIIKLHDLLEADNIPHAMEYDSILCGYRLSYPCDDDKKVLSAILHRYSYGQENGLIEIMGLLTDEESEHDCVAGWLTADDVHGRIKRHWMEEGGKNDE